MEVAENKAIGEASLRHEVTNLTNERATLQRTVTSLRAELASVKQSKHNQYATIEKLIEANKKLQALVHNVRADHAAKDEGNTQR
jgi:uncharacterized protein YlxW (UPF0749 family)